MAVAISVPSEAICRSVPFTHPARTLNAFRIIHRVNGDGKLVGIKHPAHRGEVKDEGMAVGVGAEVVVVEVGADNGGNC